MSMKNVFCPSCGHKTQINDEKPFSFCTECGNKIVLHSESENVDTQTQPPLKTPDNTNLDKKLEEVDFYYKLSFDKKEYENTTDDPTYYLKAQDVLIDLSEQYPDDYRIWWELCKPVDFMCSSSGADIHNQYIINEDYFGKALDKADLAQKRKLIDEHDKYINNKAAAQQLAEQKLAEQERLQCEQKAKKEKQKIEEKNRAEVEKAEKEKQLIEEREATLAGSKSFWSALSNKNYDKINNTYFEIPQENNQTVIAIFMMVSNMLYLNAYRIDESKNAIYQEQGFAMQFNSEGYAIKFDNQPIRIKGFLPPNNLLRVTTNQNGDMYVNNFSLKTDSNYIANIIKTAKKPLFSLTKIFI